MDPSPSALWSVVLGLAVGCSLPGWRSDRPAAPSPAHSIEGCDAELRELLATRERLEWWRLLAVIASLIAGLLALSLVLTGLCLAGLCRCCCGGGSRGPTAGAAATRVKAESRPRLADARVLELLAAAEVRR